MSAGPFTDTFYELDATNSGLVVKAKVQPETLAATDGSNANVGATGPADLGITAKVSKGNNEFGIKMRRVSLTLVTGTPAGGVESTRVTIPVMTPATYAAWVDGTQITYLGATWQVRKRFPEELT